MDHSGAISDNLWVLGPSPFFEYLTHFEIWEIQFFSNSPRDHAHWNRTAILELGWHRFDKLPDGCRDPPMLMCRDLNMFLDPMAALWLAGSPYSYRSGLRPKFLY